jgi:hypothetical protein
MKYNTLQCLGSACSGNTKGGSFTVPFTSCLTGLDLSVLQIKTKIVSCHTTDSKPVKQEVNSTVIFPPLVFPGMCVLSMRISLAVCVKIKSTVFQKFSEIANSTD